MSPIKGVTEVIRLPRLGKIRLGIKGENNSGITYPIPTDYFVCPDEVKKVFGEKPRELHIMFPTEDQKQWSSQFLKCYSATRGLICRGDGVVAVAKVDVRTGEIAGKECQAPELREITCNPIKCSYYQKAQCRRVMNLQFIIPDCPGFGVYQLDTSSFHSIVNVNSCLKLIDTICGRLSMIPLSLKLVEKTVQPEGKPTTARVLDLNPPYSILQAQKYAQIPPWKILLLPAPDSEAPDDLLTDEVLNKDSQMKNTKAEDELLHLWDLAKRKVWQIDMQDYQVAHYLMKNYKLEVSLNDFKSPLPPTKFKAEHLSEFIKDVERHTRDF